MNLAEGMFNHEVRVNKANAGKRAVEIAKDNFALFLSYSIEFDPEDPKNPYNKNGIDDEDFFQKRVFDQAMNMAEELIYFFEVDKSYYPQEIEDAYKQYDLCFEYSTIASKAAGDAILSGSKEFGFKSASGARAAYDAAYSLSDGEYDRIMENPYWSDKDFRKSLKTLYPLLFDEAITTYHLYEKASDRNNKEEVC